MMNTMILVTYSLYAVAGVGVTIWVAGKLDRHGVTFARSGDRYDAESGPAMSHLLVVGFSLVSLGIVSLALGNGSRIETAQQCIESLSSKLGWVIMLIGVMHFSMLAVFASMGRRHSSAEPSDQTRPAQATPTTSELLNRVRPQA
ncbi:MAG: hypothetical protein R3C49_00790 [Planctomycetaceae bacterium]